MGACFKGPCPRRRRTLSRSFRWGHWNPGKGLAVLLMLAALASCRALDTANWGECGDADGAGSAADASAVFDWSDWPGMVVAVDGDRCVAAGDKGFKWARLKPGPHVVVYSNHVHDFGHVAGKVEFRMEAGHRYVLGFATCFWCMPRRYALWVDDATTGQVAWGRRPDWPWWYL